MRIIVYVSQLWNLTGGEINTRDWSLGLKARGHHITVYTPVPGTLAEAMRQAGVAIADDPAMIGDAPDVMFGSGINETVTLVARFPETPVVQIAQQWDSWASFPSLLPQVTRYMAVDAINAEMLVNEFGVAREKVRIIYNAVNLAHLPTRVQPLPARPRRALMFVKSDSPYVQIVRIACQMRNIALDCIGYGAGRAVEDPLSAIAGYDLVIGSARTAIEGAVCGAAVLVLDHRGLAGLLTRSNLDHYQANNFGREVLIRPIDVDAIAAELDRYDPADAAAVCGSLRETAALDRQLDSLEALFGDAIAAFKQESLSVEEGRKAVAGYLSRHLPRWGEPSPRHSRYQSKALLDDPIEELTDRLSALEAELAELRQSQAGSTFDKSLLDTDGNLIEDAESLDKFLLTSGIATLQYLPELSTNRSVYRITASGRNTEHYLVGQCSSCAGPLVFALEVRPESTSCIRVQLLDGEPNGGYGEFNLSGAKPVFNRIGRGRNVRGGMRALEDGWRQLWVGVTLPGSGGIVTFILQFTDKSGNFSFPPNGESFLVRAVQLKQGSYPM